MILEAGREVKKAISNIEPSDWEEFEIPFLFLQKNKLYVKSRMENRYRI